MILDWRGNYSCRALRILLLAALLLPAAAAAATVREAQVAIALAPHACNVAMRLVVDTPDPTVVEHMLLLDDSVQPPQFAVVGALAGQPVVVGRSARLPISLTGSGRNEYAVRYLVGGRMLERCPVLVPAAPTDGLARTVTMSITSPPDLRRIPGDFPAFTWSGTRGRVTLGHFPSFVRVPLAPAGAPLTWRQSLDPRRVVDVLALVAIACGSLGWVLYRKARA